MNGIEAAGGLAWVAELRMGLAAGMGCTFPVMTEESRIGTPMTDEQIAKRQLGHRPV
jgi:hypothetical protein